MVSFSVPRAARRWAANQAGRMKKAPLFIRLVFANERPGTHGDNCLLTRDSAYVDLPFSRLLA